MHAAKEILLRHITRNPDAFHSQYFMSNLHIWPWNKRNSGSRRKARITSRTCNASTFNDERVTNILAFFSENLLCSFHSYRSPFHWLCCCICCATWATALPWLATLTNVSVIIEVSHSELCATWQISAHIFWENWNGGVLMRIYIVLEKEFYKSFNGGYKEYTTKVLKSIILAVVPIIN